MVLTEKFISWYSNYFKLVLVIHIEPWNRIMEVISWYQYCGKFSYRSITSSWTPCSEPSTSTLFEGEWEGNAVPVRKLQPYLEGLIVPIKTNWPLSLQLGALIHVGWTVFQTNVSTWWHYHYSNNQSHCWSCVSHAQANQSAIRDQAVQAKRSA
mgnify:CR=1 FL=1